MFPLILLLTTLLIIFLLTVLIETVVLQLTRWGNFKDSARGALIMNGASLIVWVIMVFTVQEIGLAGLLIAWLLSTLIEWGVLTRLRPGMTRYNLLVAVLANLASYLILLLPAFWYSRTG